MRKDLQDLAFELGIQDRVLRRERTLVQLAEAVGTEILYEEHERVLGNAYRLGLLEGERLLEL